MGAMLSAEGVGLWYGPRDGRPVLDVDHIGLGVGELVGITGPSGSGKTSLLYVLAGLERPQRGAVRGDGVDLAMLSESERDRWRRGSVGFVFQYFHLFPGLSALDNALLPATFDRAVIPRWLKDRARQLLADVRLPDARRPVERLSRGEMQRVALARALLFAPPVLVADEPTASLDAESATLVTTLLVCLARESGSSALVVSHDAALLARLDRVEHLVDGRLVTSPGRAATGSPVLSVAR